MKREHSAVRLMIAQAALFAAETAVIHHVGPQMSLPQLAFVRAAAGILLALILMRHLGLQALRTRQLRLHLLRGGFATAYLWVMVYSFSRLPFADATAISYTQAIYIAAFSVLILGEAVSRARWVAAAIGMVGALLIAKPAFAGWNGVYLVALFGTGLNGVSFVLSRFLQHQDSEATTLFYGNLVAVAVNSPALFIHSGLPSVTALWWMPAVIVCGPLGVYAGIAAARRADTALLGPYTLIRLVIGGLGSLILFRELPDPLSALGAVVILASCILSSTHFSLHRPAHA